MPNFINAPHRGGTGAPAGAPNAALLIDFDNVTMGIRSDLTRQLKDLLNSDIIKGKVAVQRAYADWRRYAQYIVPLSEASVDLIFAPAYGSSKKNATDIRLAIDALELVFTRPEIGTYILLSGDSDFSSLVLKLKEYGKYVIGVGLRESASDLLVQNCDEYFSYSALTGLRRAGEEDVVSEADPWELVQRAVEQMAGQNDVMRSDRLKQVMLDLDSNFDESQLGFSKFNKFLVEAAGRNRIALRKLDNGQYEVQPFEDGEKEVREEKREERRRGRGRRERREEQRAEAAAPVTQPERAEGPERAERPEVKRKPEPRPERRPEPRAERKQVIRAEAERAKPRVSTRERRAEDLEHGYELLQHAVRDLVEQPGQTARDSDIKRRMLELEPGWDESELGFTKFSRFLRQAHDVEAIDLQKSPEGYYEANLPRGAQKVAARAEGREREQRRRERPPRREREAPPATQATPAAEDRARPEAETAREERVREMEEVLAGEAEAAMAAVEEAAVPGPVAEEAAAPTKEPEGAAPAAPPKKPRYGRRGARRGAAPEGPPPLLPGQAIGTSAAAGRGEAVGVAAVAAPEPEAAAPEPEESGVPAQPAPEAPAEAGTEPEAVPAAGAGADFDPAELGLPTEEGAVIRYLSNSYQGVGQKTAEALIKAFGADRVFNGLHAEPERVREILGSGRRTDGLLNAWQRDYRRRTSAGSADAGEPARS